MKEKNNKTKNKDILKHIIKNNVKEIAYFCSVSIALSVTEVAVVYYYTKIISTLLETKIDGRINDLLSGEIIIVFFIISINLYINWLANRQIPKLGYSIIGNLTRLILEKNAKLDLNRSRPIEESKLLSLVLNECARTAHAVLVPFFAGINKLVVFTAIICYVLMLTGPALLVAIGYIGVIMLAYKKITQDTLSKTGEILTKLNKRRLGLAALSIQKQRELKIFEKNDEIINTISSNDKEIEEKQGEISQISLSSRNVVEFLVLLPGLILIYYGHKFEIDAIAVIGFLKCAPITYQIFGNYLTYKANVHSMQRLFEGVNKLAEARNEAEVVIKNEAKFITVKRNEYEININKTDKIVLIGSSGGGKSTLCDALSGNLKIKNTNIFWNQELKFSIATQQPAFIEGTVKENLLFFNENSDYQNSERLIKEIFIDDSIMEKEIKTLSGGELQRVSAVRALNREADVYIFDEINAGLDSENSKKLINLILTEAKEKCCIFVLHKDSDLISKKIHVKQEELIEIK